MKKVSKSENFFMGFSKFTFFLLFIILVFHFFWAAQWPILNDESYYWDWSRSLQLSYVDAPPAIAWVAYVGNHLFTGNLGARFLVPFLYLFSTIFLIKSSDILTRASFHKDPKMLRAESNACAKTVILLFFCIPIFNIYGVLLQPDAPLFFAITGALYFALKSCEKFIAGKAAELSLIHACGLGVFIGLGVVSKYQASPFALGIFFAIVCLRGVKASIQKDSLFWMVTILLALVVSSPLFIWNIQNNFASFKFQGQHGFSLWNLNIYKFFIFIVSVIFILFPWYFYLFCKQIKMSLTSGYLFRSLDLIPIFSFLSIFIFIGVSALGKSASVHWITPAFLLLIPLVALNFKNLTKKRPKFWKTIRVFSAMICILIFSVVFTHSFQNFLEKNSVLFSSLTQKIQKGLFAGIIWAGLDHPEKNIKLHVPQLSRAEKPYFSDLKQTSCTEEPYLSSLNWRWASQLAFYMKNNPRVFSMNLSRSTYYSWRDSLSLLAGCRMFVIGEKRMYDEKELRNIMIIQSLQEFTIQRSYSGKSISMIFVDGIMKDKHTLSKFSEDIIKNARY